MKNILRIFKKDVIRIHKNVIALIVIMGITIVPCLYAWFNIAGSWDPYSNTGNLKVAVASVDDGYEGTLIPIKLNVRSNASWRRGRNFSPTTDRRWRRSASTSGRNTTLR